jgi:RNA polymerase sigma-70 factor, ECF subfamily
MTESEIISAVQAGETEPFAELVRRYHAKVIGLCLSFLANSADAEEAAQDIFVKAFESIKSFRGQAGFGTWLFRIASNHCTDIKRHHKRQLAQSLEDLPETVKESVADDARSPLSALEDKDLADKMLSHLSAENRSILLLREVSGLSYEEIANTQQISLDAVKGRLKRARQELLALSRHLLGTSNV